MDTNAVTLPSTIGALFGGGFYAGRIRVGDDTYALIVAPKSEGEHAAAPLVAKNYDAQVAGAPSFFDGRANTAALAEAGSELAKWAQALRISDHDDWYLPSRDELELLYRAFKPTAGENYCWRGDNPSSVPVGYAYSLDNPAQTTVEAFKDGGPEALTDDWYWSSTQYAGNESYAWYQNFTNGDQDYGHKNGKLRARAVRRFKI